MRIIPAIDIIDGKCVRLTQGDYAQKKVYNEDPVEVAREFEAAGIKYLHVVDLDGAKSGYIVNYSILERICSETSLRVDFGGGLKTNGDLNIAFDSGASQVTAGSVAVKDPNKVKEWLEVWGSERIVLGVDVKDEKVAINGWQNVTDISYQELISEYEKNGARYVISTDIAVDGMLTGPSLGLYRNMKAQFPRIKIIASGGVANITDLNELRQIGVEGVIIGKALYEQKITLDNLVQYVD